MDAPYVLKRILDRRQKVETMANILFGRGTKKKVKRRRTMYIVVISKNSNTSVLTYENRAQAQKAYEEASRTADKAWLTESLEEFIVQPVVVTPPVPAPEPAPAPKPKPAVIESPDGGDVPVTVKVKKPA